MSNFEPKALRPEARELYDYWRSKCVEGRLPARADIDPIEVHRLMPLIFLVDVVQTNEQPRFCMRLLGTEVVSRFDRDAKGIWMDEDETLRNVLPDFYAAVEGRTPRYRPSARHANKEYLTYDRLILPMASDGETVDMIIGVLCFD